MDGTRKKNNSEWGNSDKEKQIRYILMYILFILIFLEALKLTEEVS